jgi:surface antigen
MNRTIACIAVFAAITIGGWAALPALGQHGAPNQYQDGKSQDRQADRPPNEQPGNGPANAADDAYRAGYRAGYDDARNTRRYDDRPVLGADNRGDPSARWQRRYVQHFTLNDDIYYQTCRNTPDPAGVMAGALIGGLPGNASSRGNDGATVAGVIVSGALGAAMTRNLNCEDESYAYKAYYDGFNSGRANSSYPWRNPRSGHYGSLRVVSYAKDPDGFRCADYSQEIFIKERLLATNGRACQQPDGTWAIVG